MWLRGGGEDDPRFMCQHCRKVALRRYLFTICFNDTPKSLLNSLVFSFITAQLGDIRSNLLEVILIVEEAFSKSATNFLLLALSVWPSL